MLSLIVGTLSAIGAAAVGITKALAIIGMAVEGLKVIGNAILGLCKVLGIVKEETNVEELGDKALQAEVDEESGVKFEDFDSFKEYVKALDEYEVDPEKSELYSEHDKVEKGLQIASGLVIEKMPEFPITEFFGMVEKIPTYFDEARLKELSKYITAGDSTISDIVKYMNGTEKNISKLDSVENRLTTVEKTINPSSSSFEALDKILGAKEILKV